MVKHLTKRFAALSIRSKLLIGFGVLIALVVLEIGVSVVVARREKDARTRVDDTQDFVVQVQTLRIQMLLARQAEFQSFADLVLEGYEASFASYPVVLDHVQQARTVMADLKRTTPPLAAVADEGAPTLLDIDQEIGDYETMLVDLVTVKTVERGTPESGIAGDFLIHLHAIDEYLDAADVIEMGTSYVETFSTDFTIVLQIPTELARLEEEVNGADLADDVKAELLGHIRDARTNFVALATQDVAIVSQINTMTDLLIDLNGDVDQFVQQKLAEQTAAQADFDDIRQTGQDATSAVRVLTVVVALLFAFVIARSITVPLKALDQAAHQFAGGNYDTPAMVNSQDEIGTLAATLNSMANAVKQRETELRKTAQDLRIASEQALEADRVKSEFLATMSHELRTPLNAIIGFADLLVYGMVGEVTAKQREKLERLKANAVRLLTLINDILDLSRIEAGRVQIKQNPFAPAALAQRLRDEFTVLAEQKSLSFDMVADHTLPDTLVGDEKRVEQIVINLLSNAFKFTETGGVELHMTCDPTHATWNIQVKDTGVGIAPHARELIFEPFRQMDGSSTRLHPGTGLGLAIVQNLVRLMNGQIQVESVLGKGTVFTVTLPLIALEPQHAAEATKEGQL